MWTLRAVLALIGFTAIIAQIVLMRELIVVFYGNEISLGLMLATWLLWTAVGSSLRVRDPRKLMARLEVALAVVFPGTILAVRASRQVFQSVPGELLGPGPMLLTSLAVLSVLCVVSGWLFAAGSRLYADEMRRAAGEATRSVYLLEAVGSGVGGVLASLVLIRYLSPFEIAALVGTLNLLAAAALTGRAMVAALIVLMLPFGRLETASLAWLWHGFHLVATRNSVYGNLAVVETEGNRSLFENGLREFTVPDPAAAEEAVHFALLEQPSPRSLLLIGGGANGSLAQALRHPSLERIDYVELDPAVLELFPVRGAQVHNIDGRLFLKATTARYDVIIVNLPDPQTAQLNRYYTLEFFQEAARKLTPSGILSFQLRASEDYISPALADFLRCINKTLRAAFPYVVAIPGESVHFFAARRPGILTADSTELLSRLRSRHIATSYVREYYVPFRMMPDRMLDLESQIRPEPGTPINRDFTPIAYYFDITLWSTQFNQRYSQVFQSIASVRYGVVAGAAGLLLVMLAILMRRRPAGLSTATTGFTLIGLEMLLLLGFQAIYGYLYHQLAIIIACFMVGMACGARCPACRVGSRADFSKAETTLGPAGWTTCATSSLVTLQILAAVSGLLLYVLISHLAKLPLLFPALAILCGFLGGSQFRVASRIYFAGRQPGGLGALYALDLAGACLGALLFSAYLIPVFGFLKTAALIAIVNAPPAALAAVSSHRKPPL